MIKRPWWNLPANKNWVMAVDHPDKIAVEQYIGRGVIVQDDRGNDKGIVIERIMGNLTKPNKFEIVAKGQHYLISMLDFFGQMNGERLDKEMIKQFDETQFDVFAPGEKPPTRNWRRQYGQTKKFR